MNPGDRYLQDVMHRIAPGIPGRSRLEVDLRNHLAERVAAGEDPSSAVAHMGPPERVAQGFLKSLDLPIARPGDRLGGFLFDVGLGAMGIAALSLLGVAALGPYVGRADVPLPLAVSLGVAAAFVFILALLYFPVLETLFGQTPGKRAFGTFVTLDTGERVRLVNAIVRRIPFLFNIWPIDVAFLLFTARRQRAFDLAARTIVIGGGPRVGRPWALIVLLWGVAASLAWAAALLGSR